MELQKSNAPRVDNNGNNYTLLSMHFYVERSGQIGKASDPITLIKESGVRFQAVTISRCPRHVSHLTLPVYLSVEFDWINSMNNQIQYHSKHYNGSKQTIFQSTKNSIHVGLTSPRYSSIKELVHAVTLCSIN